MLKNSLPDLKWIDEAKKAEDKKRGPTEEQKAFAKMLGDIGRWDLFWTFTFRPNHHEEIVQRKNGEFYRNPKMIQCGPDAKRIVKRITRNGGMVYGAPGISPGWSKEAVKKQVRKFVMFNLRKSRWALFVESSKFRSCAHGHVLTANDPNVNLGTIVTRWDDKHGRADVEAIRKHHGISHYLCKGYVAKNYGRSDDLDFEFSNNCKTAFNDTTEEFKYRLKEMEFRMKRAQDAAAAREVPGQGEPSFPAPRATGRKIGSGHLDFSGRVIEQETA